LLVVIHFQTLPVSTKFYRALIDFGHVPIFAAISLLSLGLSRAFHENRNDRIVRRHYVSAALLAVVLAVASELTQLSDPARSVSIADVSRNLIGGALGLLLSIAYGGQVSSSHRRAKRTVCLYRLPYSLLLLLPRWHGQLPHTSIEMPGGQRSSKTKVC
jgi:hypothetical protein